jgi:hypothetical protein
VKVRDLWWRIFVMLKGALNGERTGGLCSNARLEGFGGGNLA